MKVVVQTDEHIGWDDELVQRLEGVIDGALARFNGHIASVEVQLSDLRDQSVGNRDKFCQMQARIEGGGQYAGSHTAMTMTEAIHEAADKLRRVLAQHFQHQSAGPRVAQPEAADHI